MSTPVVYRHQHHTTPRPLLSPGEACTRQSTLSVCGRLLALCTPGSQTLDLYDTHDVCDMSSILGPGRFKLRFIASFPVCDITDPVAVHAVCFLKGGLLAITGLCGKGAGALFIFLVLSLNRVIESLTLMLFLPSRFH